MPRLSAVGISGLQAGEDVKGDLSGFWAITVNGNWRLIFQFHGEDAELVDYLDYH